MPVLQRQDPVSGSYHSIRYAGGGGGGNRVPQGVKISETPGELRSFLGMCNAYRRFIKGYTEIAAPLYTVLKGDVPKELPELDVAQDSAYRTLIETVSLSSVLALPRSGLIYSLYTDASDHQIGASCFKRTRMELAALRGSGRGPWATAERNHSASDRECLAAAYGITTYRLYLFGEHFVVNTDRAALRWLMEISDPSGSLIRWRLRLAEYSFNVKYKQAKLNCLTDAVSRIASTGHTVVEEDADIPC